MTVKLVHSRHLISHWTIECYVNAGFFLIHRIKDEFSLIWGSNTLNLFLAVIWYFLPNNFLFITDYHQNYSVHKSSQHSLYQSTWLTDTTDNKMLKEERAGERICVIIRDSLMTVVWNNACRVLPHNWVQSRCQVSDTQRHYAVKHRGQGSLFPVEFT